MSIPGNMAVSRFHEKRTSTKKIFWRVVVYWLWDVIRFSYKNWRRMVVEATQKQVTSPRRCCHHKLFVGLNRFRGIEKLHTILRWGERRKMEGATPPQKQKKIGEFLGFMVLEMLLRCSKWVFHNVPYCNRRSRNHGGILWLNLNHPFWYGTFHEINHPTMENSRIFIGTPRSSPPFTPVPECTFSSCWDHCSFSSSSSCGARRRRHSSTGRGPRGLRSCSSCSICEPWRSMMSLDK